MTYGAKCQRESANGKGRDTWELRPRVERQVVTDPVKRHNSPMGDTARSYDFTAG